MALIKSKKEKVAAVISAGGSLGAYTAGILKRKNPDYDLVAGASVGALEAALVADGKYEILQALMTNVSDKDIYSKSPWNKKGRFHVGKAILSLIVGLFKENNSFGRADKLRDLIDEYLTDDLYSSIISKNKEVIVSVQEFMWSIPEVQYIKLSDVENFSDFRDFTYFSACAPLFMESSYRPYSNSDEPIWGFIDSGVTEILPLRKVLQMGYKNVHVYMHRHKPLYKYEWGYMKSRPKNIPSMGFRLFSVMRDHIEMTNLESGLEYAQKVGAKVYVTWLHPDIDQTTGMHFNKEVMRRSFTLGYEELSYSSLYDYTSYLKGDNRKFQNKEVLKDARVAIENIESVMSNKQKRILLEYLASNLNII